MITKEQIFDLLKYGERISLECKAAKDGLPKSVWETYSSFANTNGGIILLGVEEDLKAKNNEERFSFAHIKNPELRIKEFWDTINGSKVSSNILIDENVGLCEIDGNNIIWIEVPQADYRHKPVYINDNPLKGSYKRNHEGDYHCTETDKTIYEFVLANDIITTRQIVDLVPTISTLQGALAAINRLADKGLVVKERQGRRVFYRKAN